MKPHIEKARQIIIELLPVWLTKQTPRTYTPTGIAEFKHWMIELIGKNLKDLRLYDQVDQVEERTSHIVRNAEATADAKQLMRDIGFWNNRGADAINRVRVTEINTL